MHFGFICLYIKNNILYSNIFNKIIYLKYGILKLIKYANFLKYNIY